MPDLDSRLRAAGEQFRATNHDAVTPLPPATRRPVSRLVLAVAAAVVVVITAVAVPLALHRRDSGAPPANVSDLTGRTWTLADLQRGGADVPVRAVALTLTVSSNSIRFDDGCNTNGASITIAADSLSLGLLGGTNAGCGGDGQPVRNALGALFGQNSTVSWGVSDGRLMLRRGGVSAIYQQSTNPSELADTTWTLTGWSEGAAHHDWKSNRTDLKFIGTTSLVVPHICDGLSADIKANGGQLVVANVRFTSAACGSVDPPPSYIRIIFTGTVDWSLHGHTLTLTNGSYTLVYEAVQ